MTTADAGHLLDVDSHVKSFQSIQPDQPTANRPFSAIRGSACANVFRVRWMLVRTVRMIQFRFLPQFE